LIVHWAESPIYFSPRQRLGAVKQILIVRPERANY